MRVTADERADLEDIDEVFGEFESFGADPFVVGSEGGVMEVFVVMLPDHGGAASGGGDDVIVFPEDADEAFGEGFGGVGAAGVGHRLPAAGLCLGVIDLNAKAFEKLDRGQSDVRIELVDETGDEETDSRHVAGAFWEEAFRRVFEWSSWSAPSLREYRGGVREGARQGGESERRCVEWQSVSEGVAVGGDS